MSKVVVLGGNGFLGLPISELLKEHGHEVFVFSRKAPYRDSGKSLLVDLFDTKSLRQAMEFCKPEIVVCTAWDTEHGKFWNSSLNPKYQSFTLKFAELSFELGVSKFLAFGTMSEYGNDPGLCNSAESELIGTDHYSRAKIETGISLKALGDSFDRKTNWLRIFQAFGPNENPDRFIPGLISSVNSGKSFSIRTPNYVMDWIHSHDIASAVLYALEKDLDHFIDVGTGIGTSVKSISELVCETLNLNSSFLDYTSEIPNHRKTAVVSQASPLLLSGWRPTVSLKERIASLG